MRNHREIKMVAVTTILKTVTGSCDFGQVTSYPGRTLSEKRTNFWRDCIRVKSKDEGFGHLVESILTIGFTGSAIGWDIDRDHYARPRFASYITEGHHRITAAILLGMDEVPVSCWGTDNDKLRFANGDRLNAHDASHDPYPIYIEV